MKTKPTPKPSKERNTGLINWNMQAIYFNKRKYDIPSSWEELSGEQLVEIAGILHMQISKNEALARIFLVLIQMRKQDLWTRFIWTFGISIYTKYDCRLFGMWVLETENECTIQKVPVINRYKLFGPLDECKGFTFMEFIQADTAYLDFRKNFDDLEKRSEALDTLFAILYRERNPDMPDGPEWNGDPRNKYNPNILEYRVKQLRKVPIKYKYAALMFYHACHQRWEKLYTHIFQKADANSEGGEGNWSGALMSLAGGSINVEKMMSVNAAAALLDLDNRIEEQERLEREAEERKYRK